MPKAPKSPTKTTPSLAQFITSNVIMAIASLTKSATNAYTSAQVASIKANVYAQAYAAHVGQGENEVVSRDAAFMAAQHASSLFQEPLEQPSEITNE